jgi:hypothetical protein
LLAKKKKRTLYEDGEMDEDGNPIRKDRKMEQYLDILYDSLLKRRERQKKFMLDATRRYGLVFIDYFSCSCRLFI